MGVRYQTRVAQSGGDAEEKSNKMHLLSRISSAATNLFLQFSGIAISSDPCQFPNWVYNNSCPHPSIPSPSNFQFAMEKKLQRLRSLKQALSFKLRRRDEEIVPRDVCEGHIAVYAAKEEWKRRRFVIPLDYLKHPVFKDLLRMAEGEFGFDYHTGLLTLPCDPSQFEEIINGLKHLEEGDYESSRCNSLPSRRNSCRSTSFDAAEALLVH